MKARALGLDLGSAALKLVGVDESGAICYRAIAPAEPVMERQAVRMLEEARRALQGERLAIATTGYGRKLLTGADRVATEITCHARGVFACLGQAGTLIDIGGQDSKVIALGPGGQVQNFAMNDKCAAGTGRFLEVAAARLGIPIERLGERALSAATEVPISSTCTVFAESEIVSLLARGTEVDRIARGLCRSLVARVIALAQGIGPKPPFMLSGGVAKNAAVRAFAEAALGQPVALPEDPQLMGAYGAALLCV